MLNEIWPTYVPTRYRCHLECILLKMAAISLPTGDFNHYPVGHAYSSVHSSSVEAAGAAVASLPDMVNSTAAWHSSFFNSSLPPFLADTLVNTLSTWRTGMYFANKDWRQWETYDCVDTDPVECDASRSLPLVIMYPELMAGLLRAWADSQCRGQPGSPRWWHLCVGEGQISESVAEACGSASEGNPDVHGGRLQGDATTVFSFYVFHLVRWTNDTALLDELWPYVKRAVKFTMSNAASTPVGLPYQMDPMWDILALANINYVLYNAVWYLVSLQSAERLALVQGDASFAAMCAAEADAVKIRIDNTFWEDSEQRWRPINDSKVGRPNWLMADDFLAYIHGTTAGLPLALNATRVRSHLENERRRNLSPFGVRSLTCAAPDTKPCDHDPAFLKLHGLESHETARIGALYSAPTAAPRFRRGSIGLKRFGATEPVPQAATCMPDPYMAALADHTLTGSPLATIAMPGSNMSACQQRCCELQVRNNSRACVAAALTGSRCELFGDASATFRTDESKQELVSRPGTTLAWVMWVTPTPGDCPRMNGDPATCSKYCNANCRTEGTKCLHTHPPSPCGAPQDATFQHGSHDAIWGMTTPDLATSSLRYGAVTNASEALDLMTGYFQNTRVSLRDQWNWAAVTATETTGDGPGGQPWCEFDSCSITRGSLSLTCALGRLVTLLLSSVGVARAAGSLRPKLLRHGRHPRVRSQAGSAAGSACAGLRRHRHPDDLGAGRREAAPHRRADASPRHRGTWPVRVEEQADCARGEVGRGDRVDASTNPVQERRRILLSLGHRRRHGRAQDSQSQHSQPLCVRPLSDWKLLGFRQRLALSDGGGGRPQRAVHELMPDPASCSLAELYGVAEQLRSVHSGTPEHAAPPAEKRRDGLARSRRHPAQLERFGGL